MFDTLTDKFTSVFRSLSGKGRNSEENIRESMREVRTALLEADVNFKVVKDFTEKVVEKAIGQEVIKSLQPGQLMVKIVYDELLELLGPVDTKIYFVQPGPTVIMMCGLQGSGKTTTCGKLAKFLLGKGHHPLLAAADLQRPAAVEQLRVLGEQAGRTGLYRQHKNRTAWAGGEGGGGCGLSGGDGAGEGRWAGCGHPGYRRSIGDRSRADE